MVRKGARFFLTIDDNVINFGIKKIIKQKSILIYINKLKPNS